MVDQTNVICLISKYFTTTVKEFLGFGPPNHGRQAPSGVQLTVVNRQETKTRFFASYKEVQTSGHYRATAIA